jgi:hypothetical protein
MLTRLIEIGTDEKGRPSMMRATPIIKFESNVAMNPKMGAIGLAINELRTTKKAASIVIGTKGSATKFETSAYTDTFPNAYMIYGSVAMYAANVVTKSTRSD